MADTKDQKQQTEADTGSVTTHSSTEAFTASPLSEPLRAIKKHRKRQKPQNMNTFCRSSPPLRKTPDIDGLLILLNTAGGDVEAGLAIAELIAGMHKPTISLVLGGGHSIGIPLAVAAQRTLIAPSASMMLHPVRISGTVIGAPQTYEYFRQIQTRITRFIVDNSSVEESELNRRMMETGALATEVGTVLGAQEAVAMGLCDAVGTLHDALAWLHSQTKK